MQLPSWAPGLHGWFGNLGRDFFFIIKVIKLIIIINILIIIIIVFIVVGFLLFFVLFVVLFDNCIVIFLTVK